MSDQGLGEASGQEARPQPGTSVSHTPGPWAIYRHFAAPDGSGYEVKGATRDDDVAEGMTFANACLVAAAPDLLEALTRIMGAERAASKADREVLVALRFEAPDAHSKCAGQTRAGHELTAAWDAARAAIAKATSPSASIGGE